MFANTLHVRSERSLYSEVPAWVLPAKLIEVLDRQGSGVGLGGIAWLASTKLAPAAGSGSFRKFSARQTTPFLHIHKDATQISRPRALIHVDFE
jgi:hypothetical protein